MDWLQWLNTNSGAVTAIASAAVVLVTIVYVVFTILLWRATKAQAEITRQAFETGHRPYVTVKVEEEEATRDLHVGALSCTLALANHGPVTAGITRWGVGALVVDETGQKHDVELDASRDTPTGMWLAPGTSMLVAMHFTNPHLRDGRSSFGLHVRVEYRGMQSSTYSTDFIAEACDEPWRVQGYRMT